MLAIVRHIVKVYETSAMNPEEIYIKREEGEIPTQVYPHFPIIKERAVYTRDCNIQDKKQRKESCQKEFPSHSKLTPGLYLVTCGCKNHICYGFSMMTSGESPSMLFNLVMTRFEANYNPQIIYDASCLAKEYGYNRELRRFMSLAICTDKFHECNHTRCSDAFKSSIYSSLESINTEACEQTNHVLRKVANSTTFMSPKLYLRAITLFLAEMNYSANQKK